MKTKPIILTAILGAAGCLASIGMAAGTDEVGRLDDQALILKDFDRLYIETPVAADLAVMSVRVFGPDNEILLNTRTLGESVEFMVNSGLPDGEYRYEVVSVFGNVDLSDRSKSVPGESKLLRNFGTFTVSNGRVLENVPYNQLDDASLMDKVIKQAVNLAGIALDVLIPSAHAVNLTAESSSPDVWFDDTGDEDCTPSYDWRINGEGGASNADTGNMFRIIGVGEGAGPCASDIPIITLNHNGADGAASSENSLIVDSDGDIHWANSGLNFDRGVSALSIGTVAVRRDLTIASGNPGIDLFHESFSDSMGTNYDGFYYNIYNTSGADVVRVNFTAPANSVFVQGGTGRVGLGTASPAERLHVTGNIRTDDYFRGQSINPGFWIDETGAGNKGANVVLDGGVLQFQRRAQGFGAYEAAPVRVFINAPTNSFVLNGLGYLGLGINPTTPIHAVNGARLSIGGVWQNASSRDLKENIHELDSGEALAAFKALEPVTFNYKVDAEETYIGFIAEDVPKIVANNDRATLSSMDIIALLTRVVQDQQNTIETQAQLVEQQNERMDQLETMIRMVSGLENTDGEVVVNTR